MPHNAGGIPPNPEITGTSRLPLSRVKKVIATDKDISLMSNRGAFVLTLATEMFIQYLTEQAHHIARTDRKPRRSIQYGDIATAIANQDKLEFLSDLVPPTVSLKIIRQKATPASQSRIEGAPAESSSQIFFGSAIPPQNDQIK